MKKLISIVFLTFSMSFSAMAQDACSDWTFNTRAWCTNYFTTAIYDVAEICLKSLLVKGNGNDSLWAERIVPDAQLMFPIGMGKKGFDGNDIYGPYHRAFANPFKHIGDYAVGADVSYMPKSFGLYAGAYFKSQAIHYKNSNSLVHGSLRGYYIQPRLGILIGGNDNQFEAGAFYDAVVGSGGTMPGSDKDMLKSGFGLDFGFSHTSGHSRHIIQFSMPLHNFLDTDFPGQKGMKRKVGYIMLTERVYL